MKPHKNFISNYAIFFLIKILKNGLKVFDGIEPIFVYLYTILEPRSQTNVF